jgi:hypothetical protein
LKTCPKVQQRAWDFPFPIFHSSSYLVVPFVRQGKGPAVRGINFAHGMLTPANEPYLTFGTYSSKGAILDDPSAEGHHSNPRIPRILCNLREVLVCNCPEYSERFSSQGTRVASKCVGGRGGGGGNLVQPTKQCFARLFESVWNGGTPHFCLEELGIFCYCK